MNIRRIRTKPDPKPTIDLQSFDKINFGCGHDKREGYLNVDVDPACGPDLLIVNNDYSVIPQNSYKQILANDVLEHIPRSETLSILLDWAEYLKPKGKLHIQTSSILGVAEQLKKKKSFPDQYGWTICLFGNQAHPGDIHFAGFTESTLKTNILAAGYSIDSFELKDKWLFHVDCHKSSDWKDILKKCENKSDEDFTQAVFKAAFGRKPDEMGGAHILNGLKDGSLSRKAATKHLFQSTERLYYIAKKNNL